MWEEGGGDLILEIVWSVFASEDEFASAVRRCTAQLSSGIVEPGCGAPHAGVVFPLIRGGRKLIRRLAGSVSLPITLAT